MCLIVYLICITQCPFGTQKIADDPKNVLRDAPFDFWGGGGLDYYFQLCFFSEKLAHNFFFSTDLETNIFFVLEKKRKHFFCDSSYLIKYVDKCHALTLKLV